MGFIAPLRAATNARTSSPKTKSKVSKSKSQKSKGSKQAKASPNSVRPDLSLSKAAKPRKTKSNFVPLPKKKGPIARPQDYGPLEEQPTTIDALYPEELATTVSDLVVGLANRLDSFFGQERSDDERNGSTLRLTPSYTFYSYQPPAPEMGVNLNLKLRNLEAKAKAVEATLREEILEKTELTDGLNNLRGAPSGRETNNEDFWYYNFESKLAARPALYYSGKFRVRKNFTGDFFLHHFSLSAGWDSDDYWSQRTGLSSDHALSETLLFRFNNDADWFISRDSFQTAHGPSLIQNINKYNSVSYNFRVVGGLINSNYEHFDSNYSINYRHGTPSQKIFADLIPTYSYPRWNNYREVRSFEFRLEYFFGNL